jgi:hypothetical protein
MNPLTMLGTAVGVTLMLLIVQLFNYIILPIMVPLPFISFLGLGGVATGLVIWKMTGEDWLEMEDVPLRLGFGVLGALPLIGPVIFGVICAVRRAVMVQQSQVDAAAHLEDRRRRAARRTTSDLPAPAETSADAPPIPAEPRPGV